MQDISPRPSILTSHAKIMPFKLQLRSNFRRLFTAKRIFEVGKELFRFIWRVSEAERDTGELSAHGSDVLVVFEGEGMAEVDG